MDTPEEADKGTRTEYTVDRANPVNHVYLETI